MSAWKKWRNRRRFLRAGIKVLNEKRGNAPVRSDRYMLRRLNDEALLSLRDSTANDIERAVIERELDRRAAWEAPAGRAFWISLGALAVSIGALIVSATH